MKKLLLFCISFCHITSFINGFQIDVPLNQKNAKKSIMFSNGKSYQDLEDELRQKHKNLPEFIISKRQTFSHFSQPFKQLQITDDNFSTLPGKSYIFVPKKITKMDYEAAKFALTHEIGHSKFPNYAVINYGSTTVAFLPIFYYWKKLIGSSAYYKNRFTKYGSKYISANIATKLLYYSLSNIEERRADNFAIKHSELKNLQAAKKDFSTFQEKLKKEWSLYRLSKYIPFALGQYYMDPKYPSTNSRIRKIEKAIAKQSY